VEKQVENPIKSGKCMWKLLSVTTGEIEAPYFVI
jgi:hypothetical protein